MMLAIKTKEKWYLQWHEKATYGSNKEPFQKMPIYKATKNFISLQILQLVSIIWKYFKYFDGPNP